MVYILIDPSDLSQGYKGVKTELNIMHYVQPRQMGKVKRFNCKRNVSQVAAGRAMVYEYRKAMMYNLNVAAAIDG